MGRLRQSTEAIQRILDESDGLREFTERELNTLKGEGEGSIKQALNEVLGGASEAYDTLKEIEEYIEKDEAGAVALTQSITRLETEKVSKEDIDSALSTESENPVMNKVITEELNKKASIDGTYPDLTAGDLAGRGESVPAEFGFRASGGKSIKDGRAYIKRIKGNSVVWNQWAKSFEEAYRKPYYDDGITYNGNKVTIDNWHAYQPFRFDIKCSTAKDHLYLVLLNYANTNPDQRIYIEFGGENAIEQKVGSIAYFHRNIIYNNEYKDAFSLYLANTMEGTITLSDLQVIDLTKMFGAGNEPSTIEEFNARVATLGVDMYAYNEGQVIHCNTESIKSVGDNAWDEEWETGTITTADGIPHESEVMLRSKNYIKVLPSQTYHYLYSGAIKEYALIYFYDDTFRYISYYSNWKINHDFDFTTPPNCCYIKFVEQSAATYKNDIMISLVHSGWKQDTDAGYQEYWQDTLPLPIIRKYFPDGMKSAGTAHDEIRYNKASGKWEKVQRVTSLDLGTLAWGSADSGHFYVQDVLGDIGYGNLICAKYSTIVGAFSGMLADKAIGNNPESPYNNAIFVRDDAYTDAASFKAAMQGVMLYYELAEPVIREIDEPIGTDYRVADFGTEQAISSIPSAPFSADIIYQFNAVDMIREHELEITELQSIIATMQAQLTSLINGGQ